MFVCLGKRTLRKGVGFFFFNYRIITSVGWFWGLFCLFVLKSRI